MKLAQAGVSKIEIERAANKARIKLFTARPGLVIGKKGIEIENLKRVLENKIKREVIIDIQEVRKPEVDAQLGAVQRLGGEVGIPTPLIAGLIGQVHEIESGDRSRNGENLRELWRSR